jgi:glutathione S-transferase
VLVTPAGSIGESAEILAWVDGQLEAERRLLPAGRQERREVQAVCRRLDEGLGPSGRRLMYVLMLGQRDLLLRYNNRGVPAWEDRAIRWGWPFVVRRISRALEIRPGVEAQDEARMWEEFDFVAGLLANGGPYLLGERFGAADLTFASLSASLLVPPIYGVPLPQPDVLPASTAALVERFREHPAGRYALGLIAEQRLARPTATPEPVSSV